MESYGIVIFTGFLLAKLLLFSSTRLVSRIFSSHFAFPLPSHQFSRQRDALAVAAAAQLLKQVVKVGQSQTRSNLIPDAKNAHYI